MRIIENISVFYSKVYYPLMEKRSWGELKRLSYKSVHTPLTSIDGRKYNKTANRYDNKFKYPKNCIEVKSVPNRHKGKNSHPTQKPVMLMEYLIKTYTKNSDVVLDFAIGSGTTAIACERLNRRWVGIEIEEKYCEIAAERIKAELQQGKLFETI
jgi:site-specific DNA-methyltransferase (adenine-specific)